jgi:trans-aconitate 2-methyltransferase
LRDPKETELRLQAAGFTDIEVFLSDAPTPFPTRQAFHDFVSTVILRAFLAALPKEERAGFVDAFVDACSAYHLDYVRLNIAARRRT